MNEAFDREDITEAHGIVVEFLSQKSDDIPEWDEISGEEDPEQIRVFISDKSVGLPPSCSPMIAALLEDAGLKGITVVYEHAEPIELY